MKKSLYKLLLTQGLSLIGSRMTGIALGIWLFKTTGKATSLLLIPFFNELPTLFLGYFGGVLIDRLPRKRLLVLSDLGQALATLFLLISVYFSFYHVSILFGVVFVQGLFIMLQEPAADSTIGWLTNDENRDRVNGIKEMLFPAAGILGPALAGLLYPLVGLEGILVFDLCSFIIAATVLSTLKLDEHVNTRIEKKSFIEDGRAGLSFLNDHKGLLGLILYFSLTNFLLNGPLELMIPIALSLFNSEYMLSVLLMAMSLATFIGAFLVGQIKSPQNRVLMIFSLMTINALMLIGFGFSKSMATMIITIFFAMMPLPMVSAYFKSILQKEVPAALQGRVFSISFQIAYGSAPLSFLIVGPLVDKLLTPLMTSNRLGFLSLLIGQDASAGMRFVFVIAGSLILLTTLIGFCFKKIRHLEKAK